MPVRKPSPVQRIGAAGNLPKVFPKLPDEFVRKFKELEGVNKEGADFWYDAVSVIMTDSAEIRQRLNAVENQLAALKGGAA